MFCTINNYLSPEYMDISYIQITCEEYFTFKCLLCLHFCLQTQIRPDAIKKLMVKYLAQTSNMANCDNGNFESKPSSSEKLKGITTGTRNGSVNKCFSMTVITCDVKSPERVLEDP